jgi:hypothetical protein
MNWKRGWMTWRHGFLIWKALVTPTRSHRSYRYAEEKVQLDARTFNAWRRASPTAQAMFLARTLTAGQRPLAAIAKLIALTVCMASVLSAEMRICIAEQLRSEADTLAPPFDRRALH